MGILGLKLRTNTPCADVIKILKQFDPDASISNLRFKIIHNDFVYVCDYIDEDGIITLLNLLHEVEAIKIDVDIYEQSENGDRKVTPFLLQNLLEQYKEIAHQYKEICSAKTNISAGEVFMNWITAKKNEST